MSLKRIIYSLIIISLISGAFLLSNRMKSEESNPNVEIVLDYNEIDEMASTSNKSVVSFLKMFKKMGINTVALSEMTLNQLSKEEKSIVTTLVSNLNKDNNWRDNYSSEIVNYIDTKTDKHDVIVKIYNLELFRLLKNRLEEIYPESLYKIFEFNNYGTIVLDGTLKDSYYAEENVYVDFEGENIKRPKGIVSSVLLDVGLGFSPEKIKNIKVSGLEVVLRPMNYSRYSKEKTNYFIEYTKNNNMIPRYMLFTNEVLGYPDNLDIMIEYIKSNSILPIAIESSTQLKNIEQDGIEKVMKSIDYETTRAFSILDYIQKRFEHYNYDGAEEIENSMYRAITERNVRLIYFKPFKHNDKEFVLESKYYEQTFNSLEKRLEKHDLKYGPISGMKTNHSSYFAAILLTYGLLALGIYMLLMIFDINKKYYMFLMFISIIIIPIMYYLSFDISAILFAFISAILFSMASSFYLLKDIRKLLTSNRKSKKYLMISIVRIFFLTISIALIGGLFIGALLSHSKYLLEFSTYRGVILSEILPLGIFSILYLLIIGYDKSIKEMELKEYDFSEIMHVLNSKVKIKYVIMSALLLVFGYVYIARSGHDTDIQPSTIEMIFRNFLENNLLARPRTKEFLIAFPSLMVAIYLAYYGLKKYIFPFALVSVIGFTSIINTFCHLRTPIYLSFVRTVYSAMFGLVLGSIVLIVLDIGLKKMKWIRK